VLKAFMKKNQIFTEIFELFLVVLIALTVRFYVVSLFRVSGPSMCNTLNYIDSTCRSGFGDIMLVNHFKYIFKDPIRGEVVVFKPEGYEDYLVKRVIGVSGDKIIIENGFVYRENDGVVSKIDEFYLNSENLGRTFTANFRDRVEYIVPDDSYFLLGDNRNHSSDSRNCFSKVQGSFCDPSSDAPFVVKKHISGKSEFVIWPLSNIHKIKLGS
jgi:signal peptidase I